METSECQSTATTSSPCFESNASTAPACPDRNYRITDPHICLSLADVGRIIGPIDNPQTRVNSGLLLLSPHSNLHYNRALALAFPRSPLRRAPTEACAGSPASPVFGLMGLWGAKCS